VLGVQEQGGKSGGTSNGSNGSNGSIESKEGTTRARHSANGIPWGLHALASVSGLLGGGGGGEGAKEPYWKPKSPIRETLWKQKTPI
jgi:hypothetical protein